MIGTPRGAPSRRLSDGVRRKLEVTTAMAWEALVETHATQASTFVRLLDGRMALEESLPRYLRELDLDETMASAVRTRVLMGIEQGEQPPPRAQRDPPPATPHAVTLAAAAHTDADTAAELDAPGRSWLRLRPDHMVRDVMKRQRRNEETERIMQLAIARAEENVIKTHVENAISFAALLEAHLPLDRAVEQYVDAASLSGARAATVVQRAMARLAEIHLPL